MKAEANANQRFVWQITALSDSRSDAHEPENRVREMRADGYFDGENVKNV